jgi:hypothetical protein
MAHDELIDIPYTHHAVPQIHVQKTASHSMLICSHDRVTKRQFLYNAFSRLLQMHNLVLSKLPIPISAKLQARIPEFKLDGVVLQGVLVP